MKKTMVLLCISALVAVLFMGCAQQAAQDTQQDQQVNDVQEQESPSGQTPAQELGDDLDDVAAAEEDLSFDGLEDIDAGLSDLENI